MGYQGKRQKLYKVLLIMLIALSSISAAKSDLNQLITLANEVHSFADRWFGDVLPPAQARSLAVVENCSEKKLAIASVTRGDFHWIGHLQNRKSFDIKGSGNLTVKPSNRESLVDTSSY